jgi:hypothetical protein
MDPENLPITSSTRAQGVELMRYDLQKLQKEAQLAKLLASPFQSPKLTWGMACSIMVSPRTNPKFTHTQIHSIEFGVGYLQYLGYFSFACCFLVGFPLNMEV